MVIFCRCSVFQSTLWERLGKSTEVGVRSTRFSANDFLQYLGEVLDPPCPSVVSSANKLVSSNSTTPSFLCYITFHALCSNLMSSLPDMQYLGISF